MAQFEQETSYDSSEPNSITNSSTQEGEHTIQGDEEEEEEEEGAVDALADDEVKVDLKETVVEEEEEDEDERTLATTPTNEMAPTAQWPEVVESLPRDEVEEEEERRRAAKEIEDGNEEIDLLRKKLVEVSKTT
jgi:hypothetical protein